MKCLPTLSTLPTPTQREPSTTPLGKVPVYIALMAAAGFCVSQTATAQSLPLNVEFGRANDGLAGFTQSTTDPEQESWSLQANSVRYIVDGPDGGPDIGEEGGTRNGSLLRRISLDRTPGQSYRIDGTARLADGYADDNNRIGLYLFGGVNDLGDYAKSPGESESGALSLLYNTDKGDVRIYEGITLSPLANKAKQGGYGAEDDAVFANTRVRFAADLRFQKDQTIEVIFTLVDDQGDITTVDTIVQAADYTGDYFGFATRARNRGVSRSNRNAPFTIDYENISVTKTDIPEPMRLALWVGALAGLLVGRRRRAPT